MPDLYFYPMACSLAARIAAYEAGVELRYRRVDDLFGSKHLVGDGGDLHSDLHGDLRAVSAMGKVPVLVSDDGVVLTENAAVLPYIADLNPHAGLAPLPGDFQRYRLQQWLSFVGTEVHKGFNYPNFAAGTPDSVKAWTREHIDLPLSYVASHLDKAGAYLLGERFTVADAYLIWALMLAQFAGADVKQRPSLVAYIARVQQRPRVKDAIGQEREMYAARH